CSVGITPCSHAVTRNGCIEPAAQQHHSHWSRRLPTVVLEKEMSDTLPKPVRVSYDPLARRAARRAGNGCTARRILPGLLLGRHVCAVCRRRNESRLG